MPDLPSRPSAERLRKLAKRLAREGSTQLAAAQRALAKTYGYATWTELLRDVARRAAAEPAPLLAAVRTGDIEHVRRLLAEGANPRIGDGRDLPLHLAARRGPLALVETLIAGGALVWQTDRSGRTALDAARRSPARDRAAIAALLDRTVIAEPSFRAAVEAIHAGDAAQMAALLAARPSLLHERNLGREAYRIATRHDYFRDPKLMWFIAGNPALVEHMAPTIVAVARVLIDAGVERDDLDYTLELVMTSSQAREQGHQISLMRLLIAAGARARDEAIIMAAGHGETAALRELLTGGTELSAPIAAALGDTESLPALLARAGRAEVQTAFGLAVINHRLEAARLALDAGADVDAYLPVHSHSTALHQAASDDRVDLIEFLLARGARSDIRDTLWSATPLQWAVHANHEAARAALAQTR